jgi:TonB family protein
MTAVAMAYAIAAGTALAIAGAGLDRLAAVLRLPRRAIWACALVATLCAASLPWLLAPTPLTPVAVSIDVTTTSVGAAPNAASPASAIQRLRIEAGRASVSLAEWGRAAGWLWLFGTLCVGLVALARLIVLSRRRRQWKETSVDGVSVLVSRIDGPGIAGTIAPKIVLPQWALDLDATALQLVLQHEREHLAARDPLLVRLAALAVLLTPWNPAVWWIVSRLKLAIELDCDARVLARADRSDARFDVADYAELLLAVATHRSYSPALSAPAMLEPPSSLGRRIAAMTPIRSTFMRVQGACAAGVALAVLAMMFTMPVPRVRAQSQPAPAPNTTPAQKAPAPTKTTPPAKAPARATVPAKKAAAPKTVAPAAQKPTPIVVPAPKPAPAEQATDVKPEEEFGKGAVKPGAGVTWPRPIGQVDPTYTSEAMRAKIQGTVRLAAVILPNGQIGDVKVLKSLDRQYGLDEAAIEAARKWRFTPCRLTSEDRAVACDIEMELDFRLH